MNLDHVMDEVAEQLRTIVGLRAVAYPDGEVNAPCAVVAMPSAYNFDATYDRGADTMTLPVVVMVSGTVPRTAKKELGAYCDGSGDRSVKAVIEAGSYTAFDFANVTGIDFDVYENGGVGYPCAIFSIDIVGSGS